MVRIAVCLTVIVLVVMSLISSASGTIFSRIKSMFFGKTAVMTSDCIENVVAKARSNGDCNDISPEKLVFASKEAFECFRAADLSKKSSGISASPATLEMIGLTIQKYCQFQSSAAILHDVSGVADDLNTWGHYVRTLGDKLALMLTKVGRRSEEGFATQNKIATALKSARESQDNNAGIVAKILNRGNEDIQKLIESRIDTRRVSENTLVKVQESQEVLRQTKNLLARHSDAAKASVVVELPLLLLHTGTFLTGLQFAESVQARTMSGTLCFAQAVLLCFDILWACGFSFCVYEMTVDVGVFRLVGLTCSIVQIANYYVQKRSSIEKRY